MQVIFRRMLRILRQHEAGCLRMHQELCLNVVHRHACNIQKSFRKNTLRTVQYHNQIHIKYEHAGLICYTLLSSTSTFSLWAQNLPFQKILSSTLVCFCLLDWPHGSRPFAGLICMNQFLCLVLFLSVLVIPTCGRLSWPDTWSTFGRTIK